MFLAYREGVSRGRDTYGYTIVTLTDPNGKRFSTNGGGYDMLGTVTAEVINHYYQDRLLKIHRRAESYVLKKKWCSRRALRDNGEGGKCIESTPNYKKHSYGVTAYYGDTMKDLKRVIIDGATGFSNVQGIAKRLGLEVVTHYERGRRGSKLVGVSINETPR